MYLRTARLLRLALLFRPTAKFQFSPLCEFFSVCCEETAEKPMPPQTRRTTVYYVVSTPALSISTAVSHRLGDWFP